MRLKPLNSLDSDPPDQLVSGKKKYIKIIFVKADGRASALMQSVSGGT